MSEPVSPRSEDWSAWATLANDVTGALNHLPDFVMLSDRTAVAKALWDAGYRPTLAQIAAERARQRAYLRPKEADQ